MRAILDRVSPAATLVEALEPIRSDPAHAAVLLDIDGTLAPIVRHAADAHVPEATRTLLIEIAKRYRRRRLRQRPPRGHRPPDRRDRHDRLRRQPRRRAAAPGRHARRRSTRSSRRGPRACARSPRASTPPSTSACACAARTRTRSPPSTGAARPTRRRAAAAVREIAERAEQEGFAVHWGRKVLEVRPPVLLDKGLGIAALLGDAAPVDGGALRRRRHHRPRRLPRAARARRAGRARARACASRSAPTKRRRSWRARPT